jgi:hypothetical protein
LRTIVLFIVYAEIAFLFFLGVFLWRHADPKGDGMEMVGLSAAFHVDLSAVHPAGMALANQGQYLVAAAFGRDRRDTLCPAVARIAHRAWHHAATVDLS